VESKQNRTSEGDLSGLKIPRLILVGGFLGSGKTTLLRRAARHLSNQGIRVGLITNDQAEDLVDTEILREDGFSVQEIAGGCFCCRFGDLLETSNRLVHSIGADVLIGEPVGSCTDISATVLQPLKKLFARQFKLLPFTVVADPLRLQGVLDPRTKSVLHSSALYILKKQLEEADVIAINKTDLLDEAGLSDLRARTAEMFPDTPQVTISALRDVGVREWLAVLHRRESAGNRVVDVDYDIYAEGEAVLGWLNAILQLSSDEGTDWRAFLTRFSRSVGRELRDRSAEVAHVKALLSAGGSHILSNLTYSGGEGSIQGSLSGNHSQVRLVLNARVEMAPRDLQAAVEDALSATAGGMMRWKIVDLQCLSPGRPRPTHRYAEVIRQGESKE